MGDLGLLGFLRLLGLLLLGAVEGGEWGFYAEAAFAAAALGCGFFWGGEGEGAEGDKGGLRWWVVVVVWWSG